MWIPGITTRDSGNVIRNPNQQGYIASENLRRSLLLAPQFTKYGLYNGYVSDVLTVQKTNQPRNQNAQVTTIDVLTKQDLLPRTQLSDIIAQRLAQNGT